MSKRLNKRQQRELEELEQLRAAERDAVGAGVAHEQEGAEEDEEEEEADEDDGSGPSNLFAALNLKDEVEDEDEEEEEPELAAAPKKSKHKKKKKKKASQAATPAPEDDPAEAATPEAVATPSRSDKKKKKTAIKEDTLEGMDEVDRALAELKLKYGEESPSADQAGPSRQVASESKQFMPFRSLLAVDPKNLDADAELRRFFGSKVIASGATSTSSRSHRSAAPSSKLRYTLSKPKPNYPPPTSLTGLGMREMSEDEVLELYERRGLEQTDRGERWFTFEHSGQWREVERQFMGAVRSHDPNELMALLQVYPWHVDTLLQMSEVHRLQSDIGAASDFAERALYAFDRCLTPSFNVSSGACRLDFDRVENRPMYTALHRIISYLGRRGCWTTAFNFAKLLFSLDPLGDPHGAAFWLDFLAIKSGNGAWLLSLLEQSATSFASATWRAYPGVAYAEALALRAQEDDAKSKDHAKSDEALREAIQAFPQVVLPLCDKIGASVPDAARTHPLLQILAGHSDDAASPIHLLSHIYVSRSEALWKEPHLISWLETTLASTLPHLDTPAAKALRADALAMMSQPRDPLDQAMNTPMHICRHVLVSESTSFLGYLPPAIRNKPVHAYDPLPPSTSVSAYDAAYFNGVRARGAGRRAGSGAGAAGMVDEGFLERLMRTVEERPENMWEAVGGLFRELTGGRDVPMEQREGLMQQLMQVAGMMHGEEGAGDGRMPGGFPGQHVEDDEGEQPGR